MGLDDAKWIVGNLPNAEDGKTLTWEISLEMARVAHAPAAPSRLNCVFAIPDIGAPRELSGTSSGPVTQYTRRRLRQEPQFTLQILPCSERSMQSELLT